MPRAKHNTLFKLNYPRQSEWPYSISLGVLERAAASEEPESFPFPECEPDMFLHMCSHEWQYLEPRGKIAGPLSIRVSGKRIKKLDNLAKPFRLPNWIESDGLELTACGAKGILLVPHLPLFMELFEMQAWNHTGLLLASSAGVPRSEMRRFLKRVSESFNIPVYLLVENDAWGYFIFSVLKRGLVAPHESCRQLSIENLRYVGIDSRTGKEMKSKGTITNGNWSEVTTLRVQSLLKYQCFQSQAWQTELHRFLRNRSQCSVQDVIGGMTESGKLSFIESICVKSNGLI